MALYHLVSQDTVADLKTLPGSGNMVVFVLGKVTKGDGSAATYYWDAADTTVEDTLYYNTVQVTGQTTGRWKRVITRMITLPHGTLVLNGGKKEFFTSGTTDANGEVSVNLTLDGTSNGVAIFTDIWHNISRATVNAQTASDVVTGCVKSVSANFKQTVHKFFKANTATTTIGIHVLTVGPPFVNAPAGVPVKLKIEGI